MSEEIKKPRKKLKMIWVVLISIGLSLIINCSYLGIETFCIKTGKSMPYYQTVYGGDCIEYHGVYWHTLHLEPATTIDAPVHVGPPTSSFSFIRFAGLTAALAVIFWFILSLINRYFKTVIIAASSIALVCFLIFAGKKIKAAWEEEPAKLISITIITSDIHPGVYSAMEYPRGTLHLVPPDNDNRFGYLKKDKMDGANDPENVSKKQLKALLGSLDLLEENTNTDIKGDFAYYVSIEYKSNKRLCHSRVFGYDSFPDEWADFIKLVNETCGTDYIRENPEMATYSEDWFSETYGITADDLPDGVTMDDFLLSKRYFMQSLCGMDHQWKIFEFSGEKNLNAYLEQYYEENPNAAKEN